MAEEDKQKDLIAERDERFKNRAAAWQSIVVIIAITTALWCSHGYQGSHPGLSTDAATRLN